MIEHALEQGSKEWAEFRAGMPTASQFHRIISPKTLKPLEGARTYMCELLAERYTGFIEDSAVSDFINRGKDMEEQAVKFYEFTRDVETTKAGFCVSDDGLIGCSPDRLVGEDGGLEIKCPAAKIHMEYLLASLGDKKAMVKYRCQVQGSLWITGRSWWDLLSFNPVMPPVLIRCERDEEVIRALEDGVYLFLAALDSAKRRLEELP